MSRRFHSFPTALLPQIAGLTLEEAHIIEQRVTLGLRTTSPSAACPTCLRPSFAVHSRYTRKPTDLPWAGYAVHLFLGVRKFFCRNRACPQRIFTERLPDFVAPHARKTARLRDVLVLVAFALGGEAGARLASRLGWPSPQRR